MLQIYTGNGKGKTTAALGLTFRAAGAGLRVFFGQFMKGVHAAELTSLKLLGDNVIAKQFGTGDFIVDAPTDKDRECASRAFSEIETVVKSGRFDVVVADEICTAMFYKLIDTDDVLRLVRACPPEVELIFTGRYAADAVIDAADVVTEMREIKHCYQKGVPARAGIDY